MQTIESVTGEQAGNSPATFYRDAMLALQRARVPFLVGGAFAMLRHAGIERDTKDLDVFISPDDRREALSVLRGAGFRAEIVFPHWLAKVFDGDHYIDLIYRSGNGIAEVDAHWFEHASEIDVFGVRARLCPVEETIWSKAFVMERERYDGADIAHLLRTNAGTLDWQRLIVRFGKHWRVLFSHVVLFGFIYPAERRRVPAWVEPYFSYCLARERWCELPARRVCNGTLLSRTQYMSDVDAWGYQDARVLPRGTMTLTEAENWTDAGH